MTLELEGRIVSDWVALLEDECLSALRDAPKVVLDLSAVAFIDRAGVKILRRLATHNLAIVNASPFVAHLLRADLDQ